jgi:GNAT superfamily N-acetyltransferase
MSSTKPHPDPSRSSVLEPQPGVWVRLAEPEELDALVAIDDDASALYTEHGLPLELAPTHPFSQAERVRWRASIERASAFVALDATGERLGFAALDVIDGQPYLDQLAVRRAHMRRGVGRALLERSIAWAEQQGGDALWLTTYGHLPFNRPYYERHGFQVVVESECGPDIRHHLDEQRRALPAPEERAAMRRPLRSRSAGT